MTGRLLLVPALVVALLAPAIAYAQATPTLGELARKEEERRKALKAASTVVLTDKDVPRATLPPAPAAPAGEAPGEKPAEATVEKPAEQQAGEKSQEPVKDEAWWKERITRVREELRRNEMFADALQTRINAFATDFASQDDPYRRAEIAQQRATAIAELDRVKADLEANRKAMAAIEEEARRAAVPPGWLR